MNSSAAVGHDRKIDIHTMADKKELIITRRDHFELLDWPYRGQFLYFEDRSAVETTVGRWW
jgi:hypothetical protein